MDTLVSVQMKVVCAKWHNHLRPGASVMVFKALMVFKAFTFLQCRSSA